MMSEEPSVITFTQTGDFLAVGFKNGQQSLLKTESLEEVFTSKESLPSAVTALKWKHLERPLIADSDNFEAHFKPLIQIDPKPSEAFKSLSKMCTSIQTEQSLLVAADASGTVGFSYCGIFPLAKIELQKLLKDSQVRCDKVDVNEDFSETMILGRDSRG